MSDGRAEGDLNEKTTSELDTLIKKHFELKDRLDLFKRQDDEVKADIKLLMRSEELEKYENTKTLITYSEVSKKILDKKKVQEKLKEEDFEECFKQSTYEMLKFKLKTEEEK